MQSASKSKSVGVLGGLGPESTAEFYLDLVKLYGAAGHDRYGTLERPQVLTYSVPLDTQKEADFIKFGKNYDYYRDELVKGGRVLQEARCDFAVIPCNTVHLFLPDIVKGVAARPASAEFPNGLPKLEFMSILDLTAARVKELGKTKVLLLATGETIRSKLYQDAMGKVGISVAVPESQDTASGKVTGVEVVSVDRSKFAKRFIDAGMQYAQDSINKVETEILLAADGNTPEKEAIALSAFTPILEEAARMGIACVVLGCTDYQKVVKDANYKGEKIDTVNESGITMNVLDSLQSLVLKTAARCVGESCTTQDIQQIQAKQEAIANGSIKRQRIQ